MFIFRCLLSTEEVKHAEAKTGKTLKEQYGHMLVSQRSTAKIPSHRLTGEHTSIFSDPSTFTSPPVPLPQTNLAAKGLTIDRCTTLFSFKEYANLLVRRAYELHASNYAAASSSSSTLVPLVSGDGDYFIVIVHSFALIAHFVSLLFIYFLLFSFSCLGSSQAKRTKEKASKGKSDKRRK